MYNRGQDKDNNNDKKNDLESKGKDKTNASFAFFSTLPRDAQAEILGDLSPHDLANTAKAGPELSDIAKEGSSEYKMIIEGQEIVEKKFESCECEFAYVPKISRREEFK